MRILSFPRVAVVAAAVVVSATSAASPAAAATKFGTAGNDVIVGTSSTDFLRGAAGHDVLYGHGAWDDLAGGAGDDVLFTGAGAHGEYADCGSGYDLVFFDSSRRHLLEGCELSIDVNKVAAGQYPATTRVVVGTSGHDVIKVRPEAGDPVVVGGPGADQITSEYPRSIIVGGSGNDFLDIAFGSTIGAAPRAYAGADNDVLVVRGRSVVDCGAGTDTVYVAAFEEGLSFPPSCERVIKTHVAGTMGVDALGTWSGRPTYPFGGNDTITVYDSGDADIFCGTGTDTVVVPPNSAIAGLDPSCERLVRRPWRVVATGTAGNDVLVAEAGGVAWGLGGDDRLTSQAFFRGAQASDDQWVTWVWGRSGVMYGGSGDDMLDATQSNADQNYGAHDCGSGVDVIAVNQFSASTSNCEYEFVVGYMERNQWCGFDHLVTGTAGSDALRAMTCNGNKGGIVIGKDGADVIDGTASVDELYGGEGDDVIRTGGNDHYRYEDFVFGGGGSDSITVDARSADHGGTGVQCGPGSDTVTIRGAGPGVTIAADCEIVRRTS